MTDLEIAHEDYNPIVPVGWFTKHTDLRSVHPYVATEADQWYVFDTPDEAIALALVDPHTDSERVPELQRLGVVPERRREGIASVLVERLLDEYEVLRAQCRVSLPANDFYEATGWTKMGVTTGDPEDLVEWRIERPEFEPTHD